MGTFPPPHLPQQAEFFRSVSITQHQLTTPRPHKHIRKHRVSTSKSQIFVAAHFKPSFSHTTPRLQKSLLPFNSASTHGASFSSTKINPPCPTFCPHSPTTLPHTPPLRAPSTPSVHIVLSTSYLPPIIPSLSYKNGGTTLKEVFSLRITHFVGFTAPYPTHFKQQNSTSTFSHLNVSLLSLPSTTLTTNHPQSKTFLT